MKSYQLKTNKTIIALLQKSLGSLILGSVLVSCIGPSQTIDTRDNLVIAQPTQPAATNEPSQEIPPSSDFYAVSGLNLGEHLPLYLEPTSLSEIMGQIPAHGTELLPVSDIFVYPSASWMQVQYQDQSGWANIYYLAEQHGVLPDDLVILGQKVLSALSDYDYELLEDFIHPELCLRFSPYSYLNAENQIFCRGEITSGSLSKEERLWGHYDGTGDPINLNFNDYHDAFVYDQDYLHSPVIGFNLEVSSGNSINNISDLYPNGMMIEYHFPGIDPQYGGLDWRSIRLVLVQMESKWYLAAIIHGEWTI